MLRQFFRQAFVLAAGFSFLFSNSVKAEKSVVVDRVVAVVGNEIVLQSELELELQFSPIIVLAAQGLGPNATPAQVDQLRVELRGEVLDALVGDRLVLAEAERFPAAKLSDQELDGYLKNIAQNNKMAGLEELKRLVEESGEYGSWEEYVNSIRRQASVYKIEQMMVPYTPATDAQLRAYYRKLGRGEEAKVDVTRFSIPAKNSDKTERDTALKSAQEIAQRLRKGDSDAVAGKAMGVSPSQRSIGQGSQPPSIEESLFAAREGDIVGPLPAGNGFVVFRVHAVHASELREFEAVKDQLRMQLDEETRKKQLQQFREQLRAKNHIEIHP